MTVTNELTWIEISREYIIENVKTLAAQVGGVDRVCAVVKGNAYGHGIETIAPEFYNAGIRKYAVYHVDEAVRLRATIGPDSMIMLLGFATTSAIPTLIKAKVECLFLNQSRLEEIHGAIPDGKVLDIHLKVDTGMNRFGLKTSEMASFLSAIKQYPRLRMTGLASHFANSWNLDDRSYTEEQYAKFMQASEILHDSDHEITFHHISNSAASFVHPQMVETFVRTGISLYGYYPTPELKTKFVSTSSLKPVLSFRSRVVSIKELAIGEYAGYDITFQATRPTKLALAPVGYSDGFPFAHSDAGAYVLLHGQKVPLIGRVNMNAIFLDVTDLDNVEINDVITLLGQDGDEKIDVLDWMGWGTPHLYEALTSLRFGLKRTVI